jgi:hypothetical protein
MKLVIYRAADAFIYLPTYVAEEYGIFEALLDNTSVEFPALEKDKGDENAISKMLEASEKADTIAIAIGDPTAFLDMNEEKTRDVRVIGTVINKLSFWAVNHSEKTFETVDKFGAEFNKIIHYNGEFITGNYLGKRVSQLSNVKGKEVNFGEEIDVLENPDETEKQLAITADIVKIAKGLVKSDNPLKIHYHFSKSTEDEFKGFITTGIITTKKCCEQYGDQLSKIIEGIQKSILMLYSSEKVAQLVCEKISAKQNISLQVAEIKKIIELIKNEEFYPADLNINREDWNKAVRARADIRLWKNEDKINTSFDKYVDNRFVHNAEKSLAKQLGINDETFEFEKGFEERLKPLKEEIEQLKKRAKHYVPWLSVCSNAFYYLLRGIKKYLKFIILSIVCISLFVIYKFRIQERISEKEWFLAIVIGTVVSIIGAFFYDLIKKKNEKSS